VFFGVIRGGYLLVIMGKNEKQNANLEGIHFSKNHNAG
jgi:hypothetical protein